MEKNFLHQALLGSESSEKHSVHYLTSALFWERKAFEQRALLEQKQMTQWIIGLGKAPPPAPMGFFPNQPREFSPGCNHALSPEGLFKVCPNIMDLLLLREQGEGWYN